MQLSTAPGSLSGEVGVAAGVQPKARDLAADGDAGELRFQGLLDLGGQLGNGADTLRRRAPVWQTVAVHELTPPARPRPARSASRPQTSIQVGGPGSAPRAFPGLQGIGQEHRHRETAPRRRAPG